MPMTTSTRWLVALIVFGQNFAPPLWEEIVENQRAIVQGADSASSAEMEAHAAACPQSDKPAAPASKPKSAPYDPTDQYEVRRIEGWRVLVNSAFLRQEPALADDTFTLLRYQLYQITRKVPPVALAKLRRVTIWVELAEPHHPCMTYHPDRRWLSEHGMNPDKAKCVEVANARNFLRWTLDQPWMVLHELAHAYHDQFLGGFGNVEIRSAFERAMKAKRYEAVGHIHGRTERAYAARNPMEYFAEATEAFFGTNDFFPFVRSELRQHDPELYRLLERLWGVAN